MIFSLPDPKTHHNEQTTFQCCNVRLPFHASSFSQRNLLWRVQSIPQKLNKQASSGIFDSVLNVPGHLFVNDEEDGFRLTWVVDHWNCGEFQCRGQLTEYQFPNRVVGAVLTFEDTWEEFACDRYSGKRLDANKGTQNVGLRISSEAYLHVHVLLKEILRKRTFSSAAFHYNLISVHTMGRVADLIIVFTRKEKSGSLGVFVQVDLFTGCYQEQDWVKRKTLGTRDEDVSSLRSWCSALALSRRMRQRCSGPYSINTKHSTDWSRLCVETAFDADEADDYDPEIWQDYVNGTTSTTPKFISLSSLYPDCDLITNNAITSCLPVSALRSKSSPLELVYL